MGGRCSKTPKPSSARAAGRQGTARLAWLSLLLLADAAVRLPVEHLRELAQDTQYAARLLLRSKGFTIASIISVGIGIGLGTTVFSQLESLMLKDIPTVSAPEELIASSRPVSYPDYERFRDESGQFADMAAYMAPVPFVVREQGRSQRVWGHLVSPNYFDVLGNGASIGRTFGEPELARGGAVSIVISHRYWQGRLGGRPDVVGSTLRINGFPTTIIGVGEVDFLGARPILAAADIWIPATVDPRVAPELRGNVLEARDLEAFNLVGRLGPGVTSPQAEARLDAMIRQQEIDDGLDEVFEGRRITLVSGGRLLPLRDEDLPVMMALPLIMVGLALVIACSNVGTLLLARGSARAREIAIRLSVGASRGRIVRQLITEATILALLGGVAGLMFGLWSNSTTEWLDPMLPEYMTFELETSWRALLFTLGLSILSGILFGLAPALQAARSDVSPALKGDAGNLKRYRWYSMRNFLVLQQVAGSLTLLLLTGFVVLGFGRSSSVEVGFEVDDLYMMSLDPIRDGYTGDQARDFFADLPDRVRQIPGVRDASLTYSIPLGMFSDEASMQASADLDEAARLARQIRSERVGEGFFETIGVELVRGRTFGPTDDGLRVAIVNETMVAETWPGQDPVGQTLEIEDDRYQVIGVAPDFRSGRILETSRMGVFLPMDPDRFDQPSSRGVTVLVRAEAGCRCAPGDSERDRHRGSKLNSLQRVPPQGPGRNHDVHGACDDVRLRGHRCLRPRPRCCRTGRRDGLHGRSEDQGDRNSYRARRPQQRCPPSGLEGRRADGRHRHPIRTSDGIRHDTRSGFLLRRAVDDHRDDHVRPVAASRCARSAGNPDDAGVLHPCPQVDTYRPTRIVAPGIAPRRDGCLTPT